MTGGAVKHIAYTYASCIRDASEIVGVVYEHSVTPIYGYNLLSLDRGMLAGCESRLRQLR